MGKVIVLTGKRFGRLVVVEYAGVSADRQAKWKCRCDCGGEKTARSKELRRGDTTSCGCYQKEITSARRRTHGASGSKLYMVWFSMLMRCSDPGNKSYSRYGGRGIIVAERWKGPEGFGNFRDDMGQRPKGTMVERINNDGPYSPENCRWATATEQANNKRTTHYLEYNGRRMSLADWSRETGISDRLLWARAVHLKWPTEKVITQPVRTQRRKARA